MKKYNNRLSSNDKEENNHIKKFSTWYQEIVNRFHKFDDQIKRVLQIAGETRQITKCYEDKLNTLTVSNAIQKALKNIAIILSYQQNLMDAYELMLEEILCIDGIDCGGIYSIEDNTGDFILVCHRGLSDEFIHLVSRYPSDCPQAKLVNKGEIVLRPYCELSEDDKKLQEGLRTTAIVPIIHEQKTLACLNLASHTHDEFPANIKEFFEAVAAQIGSAVARLEAEENSRISEQNFVSIFNTIDDYMFIFDKNGSILNYNPSLLKRLKYNNEDILYRNLDKIYVVDKSLPKYFKIADILNEKTNYCSHFLKANNGELIPVETKFTFGEFMNKKVIIGIARDISERIKTQDELRLLYDNLELEVEKRTAELERTTEQLLYSQRRQEVILAAVPDIVVEIDPKGVYTWANRAALEFFGKDVVGRNSTDYFEGENDLYKEQKPHFKTDQTNTIYEENWQRRHDGAIRLLAWRTRLLKGAGGGLTGCLATAYDITEHKIAEEEIRKFKNIAEHANYGTMIVDLQQIIRYVNRNFAETHGYERAELVGKHLSILHSEAQQHVVNKTISELDKNDSFSAIEIWHLHKDGVEFPMLMSGVVIRDDTGKASYVAVTGIDTTKLKRSQEEQKQLFTAVEQANEIILVLDKNGVFQYANPAFEKITGYELNEVIGKHCSLMKSETQQNDTYSQLCITIKSGEVWRGRMSTAKKSGEIYQVVATISPVRDSHNIIDRYVAVLRDISREADLENQLLHSQKMEAVGRLAGGIAHDFNNLLTAIMGYNQLVMKQSRENDKVYQYLLRVNNAARRATSLTQQLLAFSRKQILKTKIFDLNKLVCDVDEIFRSLIPENIEIITLTSQKPALIKADAGQIQQVIMNLVVNAGDAMQNGGTMKIQVRNISVDKQLSQYPFVTPGLYAHLSIQDTGCGMDSDTISQIFDPFYTTKEIGKGTGLGLATVYGIVKQSKGFIGVESVPDEGSTFDIFLPFIGEKEDIDAFNEDSNTAFCGSETILLTEDEDIVRELAANILRDSGYKVLEASYGIEALEICRSHDGKIDLLLTDMVMPKMSGRELAVQIRKLFKNIKIIYMSGYNTEMPLLDKELDAKAAFIQKPFDADVLKRNVRILLDKN